MTDQILIIALGFIAIFVLRGFQLLSRDIKSMHSDVRKARETLFWSQIREKKELKLTRKIFKKI